MLNCSRELGRATLATVWQKGQVSGLRAWYAQVTACDAAGGYRLGGKRLITQLISPADSVGSRKMGVPTAVSVQRLSSSCAGETGTAASERSASVPRFDPSVHIVTRRTRVREQLDAIFKPRAVAVIGATEKPGSVGRNIFQNLLSPFGGAVYPVNPKRSHILGIRAYPNVSAIPEPIDLAVITTPARTVPSIMRELADNRVPGCVIISAGFAEAQVGGEGRKLLDETLAEARRGGTRIIGPNCLGILNISTGMNASFGARAEYVKGDVALLSQSGALVCSLLDWALKERFGFSKVASLGTMCDVDWADMIRYIGEDTHSRSIVAYVESIGNVRAFISAAREVATTKPIVVIKAGRTPAAAAAAASHTGNLTGSDEVIGEVLRRAGVLRVDRIDDLFLTARVLAQQPRPRGKNLTIITNAGGPGILAADELVSGGGALTELSSETMDALDKVLPAAWSHANPVDIIGDATPETYAKALEICSKDVNTDGTLVILTPQVMTDATATADILVRAAATARAEDKPVLASWMGGIDVLAGQEILKRNEIPNFAFADVAVRIWNYLHRYNSILESLYEVPEGPSTRVAGMRQIKRSAEEMLEQARQAGRIVLNEYESKRLLSMYEIPVLEAKLAHSEDEAVEIAKRIGFPVVAKLLSHTITHKTDVGGVKVNLHTPDQVVEAFHSIRESVTKLRGAEHFQGVILERMIDLRPGGYEVLLGSTLDPQAGPIVAFGTGGTLVEVYRDVSLGIPPLNSALARQMMERTRIYNALKGVRGHDPADLEQLQTVVSRFSRMVCEQRLIKECDINPLFVTPRGIVAIDARVVLHDPHVSLDTVPQPAIRPYPSEYVSPWSGDSMGNLPVVIRPIHPSDTPKLLEFWDALSTTGTGYLVPQVVAAAPTRDVNLRDRWLRNRLLRIAFCDFNSEMVIIAEARDAEGSAAIHALAQLRLQPEPDPGHFAINVLDTDRGHGLGTEMLRRLMDIARREGLTRIWSEIAPENRAMQRICEKLGFQLGPLPDQENGNILAEYVLSA
jgi:acetyltransferase